MAGAGFDPAIHDPDRLRIAATLAALPAGDAVSVARLQKLTFDEFSARLERTLTARTYGELAGITRDLPGPALSA